MKYQSVLNYGPLSFSVITDVITALNGPSVRLIGCLKSSIACKRVGPLYHWFSTHVGLNSYKVLLKSRD